MSSMRSGHLLFPCPDALKIGSEAYFRLLWESLGKRKCQMSARRHPLAELLMLCWSYVLQSVGNCFLILWGLEALLQERELWSQSSAHQHNWYKYLWYFISENREIFFGFIISKMIIVFKIADTNSRIYILLCVMHTSGHLWWKLIKDWMNNFG